MPSLVSSVLSSNVPPNWSHVSSAELKLIQITSGPEFQQVQSAIKGNLVIRRIMRVQNPYLWGCYLLKKEECQKRYPSLCEMDMWHMTSQDSANSIAEENFDWRRAKRCKFGDGVSFTPDSRYASKQSTLDGALILCKVLVGKELAVGGGHTWANIKIPQGGVDTTTGNSRKVFVKYCDHEFYPAYIVNYEAESPAVAVESNAAQLERLMELWTRLNIRQ